MLATVGDLVDDIVVRLGGPFQFASDTAATIERRRGGSAANVAAVAARVSGASRFLGQVGDDALGERLLGELAADRVDVGHVRRRGRTGSIVVIVDSAGERSFLTDPGSARDLDSPRPEWLDGVDVLHVPLYSLAGAPIAITTRTLIEWARARGIGVSIDVSSVSVIEQVGVEEVRQLVVGLVPDVVFANADEARTLGIDAAIGSAITFVKAGPAPVTVFREGAAEVRVAVEPIPGLLDSTGAGDAFAAGVLTSSRWRDDVEAACKQGQAAAADLLRARQRD